jgi:hypothetical protein
LMRLPKVPFEDLMRRTTLRTVAIVAAACSLGSCGEGDITSPMSSQPRPVASIVVVLDSSVLDVGQTTQATAQLKDAAENALSGRAVTWTSLDTSIGRISSDGVVTAVDSGTTTIVATSEQRTGNGQLIVNPRGLVPVAQVEIVAARKNLVVGDTTSTTVTLTDAKGRLLTGRSIIYTSENPLTATISERGVVTAVGAGTVRVQATSGGVTGQETVVVTEAAPPPPPPATTPVPSLPTLSEILLTPAEVALAPGATAHFTVAGTWSDGSTAEPAVIYSATGGAITAGGVYTAGATSGTFQVVATQQNGKIADTSIVTIAAPAAVLLQLVLSPPSVSLAPGGTHQFSVAGSWSDGSGAVPAVTYSTTGGGNISAAGLYVAGPIPGLFHVIATQQGGTKADTSTVTISAPVVTLLALVLTPTSLTLAPGGTQQFSVGGSWSDGSSAVPSVTYSATGGTITAGGLYTAGATPGTFSVIATQQSGTKADTSAVAIVAPAPTLTKLTNSPKNVTLAQNGVAQFTTSATWSDGSITTPIVTYAATGGTITAGGLYTAGVTPGTFRVIATQQGGTKADTSTVSVIAPPPPSSCVRTVNASTVSGLTSALSGALPGDCILLAPGTYTLGSGLTIAKSGTASAPVMVQGAGSNTIIDVNQKGMFVDASYFQLRRLRLTNFNTLGLWLRGVTGVVIDSVEVDHTLQEAVALKYGSHNNIVKNSLFHDTGILYPQYGEGIYIGGKNRDGTTLDFGATDNQVLNNHFGPNVRADGVDVKEGADHTLIRGNFFDGTGSVYTPNNSNALISVIASYTTIDSNFMQYGKPQGVAWIKGVGTPAGNVATRNTIDLRDIHQAERGTEVPYGFQFQFGTPGTALVNCNNVMLSGLLSNRPCTP